VSDWTHQPDPQTPRYVYCGKEVDQVDLAPEDEAPTCMTCWRKAKRQEPERILAAAIYVDTGKAEPSRSSYAYPETGLVFAGWRHGECFMLLHAWSARLWFWERWAIERIQPYQLRGRNQGFITSRGRYVDREEAGRIAFEVGQTDRLLSSLTSEDLY
jgi:hypothetical protein